MGPPLELLCTRHTTCTCSRACTVCVTRFMALRHANLVSRSSAREKPRREERVVGRCAHLSNGLSAIRDHFVSAYWSFEKVGRRIAWELARCPNSKRITKMKLRTLIFVRLPIQCLFTYSRLSPPSPDARLNHLHYSYLIKCTAAKTLPMN